MHGDTTMGRDASAKRFDVDLKLRVLAYYDKVRNKYKAAKMFGVSECSVRNWIKEEHRLRALSSQAGGSGAKKTSNRAAETRALFENCLERYVRDCQQRGVKARYRDLLAHAAQLKKVHRVRGLKLSIDWVARFVREHKLVGKCERLSTHAGSASPANNSAGSAAARKKGVTPAATSRTPASKGLLKAKHGAVRSLVKRAMGQLSSKAGKKSSPSTTKRKNSSTEHGAKAKLKSKAVSKASSIKASDGKAIKTLSKNKPRKATTKTGSDIKKKSVLTKMKKAANKTTKLAAAAKRGPTKKLKPPPAKKTKAQSAKSAAIIAKYKKCLLKKASQKQKLGKVKNTIALKKKVHIVAKPVKHKQKVMKKADKPMKAGKGKQCSKSEHNMVVEKKMQIKKEKHMKPMKPQEKVMITNKVASKGIENAKQTVICTKKTTDVDSPLSKQTTQKVKKLPLKKLRPKRQPVKVFRTRYRIKEMHRRIQENRSSDFFDFFYGLGLLPISRDADSSDSPNTPIISGSQKIYNKPGYLCNKESPLKPSTSDLSKCQPHSQLPSKYPIWTPVRTGTIHDPCSSQSSKPWRTSPRVREEHIITDRFTQSKSPEDAVFAEKFHKASLRSEGALSPGESPITPEQLAVVRKLFPPIGSLTFPSQRKTLDSQVTFSEPLKTSDRSLRPRTSEQTERLSLYFRKRRYQKRNRTFSEPSRSPERRPNCPSVSDIDWLSADGFPSPPKKSCPGESGPVYSFAESQHCFRKEHFEDTACPPHVPNSGICANSPRIAGCTLSSGHPIPGTDRPTSCSYDGAKLVSRPTPTSPKATSSSEGKDLFFGQANRLATLRKKQDKNEPVMHTAKGHQG